MLALVLSGCSHNAQHEIYGGLGNQLRAGPTWEKEYGQTYGKVGLRGNIILHKRDRVGVYYDLHHKSDPRDRDQGEENLEAGGFIRWW